MLLYLTSNQKSNLIDPAVRNMTLPAKKLVGRFSLKSFVTKDMRNLPTPNSLWWMRRVSRKAAMISPLPCNPFR